MNYDPDYFSDPDKKFRRFRASSAFFYLNLVLLAVNVLLLAFLIGVFVRQNDRTSPEADTPAEETQVTAQEQVYFPLT